MPDCCPPSHLLPGTATGKSPKSSQWSVGHVCSHMRREFETGACRRGLFSKGSAEDVLRGWGVERALCAMVWVSPPWDTAGGWGWGGVVESGCLDNSTNKIDCYFSVCICMCAWDIAQLYAWCYVPITFIGNCYLILVHLFVALSVGWGGKKHAKKTNWTP